MKQIHQDVFHFKHGFYPKCESSIHNIAFSSENVFLSVSGGEYAQTEHRLQAKTVLNKYVMWNVVMF